MMEKLIERVERIEILLVLAALRYWDLDERLAYVKKLATIHCEK
jgi:hypothetical protein